MKKLTVLATLGFLIPLTHPAFASDKFIEKGECGSAKVISGDTCSNVKVELHFDGCAIKSEPEIAPRIICSGQTIKARTEKNDTRFEASFEKVDKGWGHVEWKSMGAMKQFTKQVAAAPAAPKTSEPTSAKTAEPAKAADAAPATSAASPLKFSGFFDLRYTNVTADNDPNLVRPNAESGFGLEDGAFFVNYEKEKLSFVGELAFRRSKDSDNSAITSSNSNQSQSNFIAVGVDKSQLFFKYKLNADWALDVGQFATIYGVEVNDSKDRAFGQTGLVYNAVIPLTHQGAMIEFNRGAVSVKGFGADPNNKGSNGTSAAGDDKTEYGVAAGYTTETVRGQVGYMTRPILSGQNRTLTDITAGATHGNLSIDLEYALVDDPSKNSLTPSNTSDHEKVGTAFLALLAYKINEPWQIALRYESLTDAPNGSSQAGPVEPNLKSASSYGAILKYKLSPELELRGEYNAYTFNAVGAAETQPKRANVAAVVTF